MNKAEAQAALIAGKKIRHCHWTQGIYAKRSGAGLVCFVNSTDQINLLSELFQYRFGTDSGWELYDEPVVARESILAQLDRMDDMVESLRRQISEGGEPYPEGDGEPF
jgi:hypothetical protein